MEQSEQNQEVSEPYISQSQLPNSEEVEEVTSASKSHKSLIITLVLLLLLTTGTAVHLFSQNQSFKSQLGFPTLKLPGSSSSCKYNGQTYQPGEGFTASDGCNSCSCTETGEVVCTAMACISDAESAVEIETANFNLNLPHGWQILDNTQDRNSYQIILASLNTEIKIEWESEHEYGDTYPFGVCSFADSFVNYDDQKLPYIHFENYIKEVQKDDLVVWRITPGDFETMYYKVCESNRLMSEYNSSYGMGTKIGNVSILAKSEEGLSSAISLLEELSLK